MRPPLSINVTRLIPGKLAEKSCGNNLWTQVYGKSLRTRVGGKKNSGNHVCGKIVYGNMFVEKRLLKNVTIL